MEGNKCGHSTSKKAPTVVQMSNEKGWTPAVLDVGQIRENQIMNVKVVLGTGRDWT